MTALETALMANERTIGAMVSRALVLLLLALPTFAATTYEVTRTKDGRPGAVTVIADGERARADFTRGEDEAVAFTSVLWFGGDHAVGLNARNETWYVMDRQPLALDSRYLAPHAIDARVKNVRWTMSETNGTYTGRLAYDVHGDGVRVRCTADYVIETSGDRPRSFWPGRILGKTGLAEVDARLAAADATIARFPTRMTLTATRQYEGGPRMQDVMTIEAGEVREREIDTTTFVRPASYRQQKPVIAVPGVTNR